MELDETIREFLIESRENLDLLDQDLVALEKEPKATDRIASVFRTIHTIKGTAGFLGFGKLEKLAHAGETLLSKLRDGTLVMTSGHISILLELVDRTRVVLRSIESQAGEGDAASGDLVERLLQNASGTAVAAPVATAPRVVEEPAPEPPKPSAAPVAAAPRVVEEPAPEPPKPAPPPPPAPAGAAHVEAPAAPQARDADSSVRVDTSLLDKLVNLVGELVLARNQLNQLGGSRADVALANVSQRLDLITTELQERVMKTRMQPIGNAWSKLPRVVRDVATTCRKQVRIELQGADTELDRTILESIRDPLVHAVRNAVDHGIEAPSVRADRGKPKTGTITLRAFHEGGEVYIEVADDGGGIDIDRVRAKAEQLGLVPAARLATMSERELCQLIFLPGFSTAASVTNVSGRGVGMDVVKTNIERIGGSVDIQSHFGRGTTLRIKIPLTLAIVPAVVVSTDGQRYAIPQASLLELVHIDGMGRGVEDLHDAPVYRLRGQLLPLVHLGCLLGTSSAWSSRERCHIVVLQTGGHQFGLVVDDICDSEEIVVKPLGAELQGLEVYAGATLMGDGRVALILDAVGVAQRAGVIDTARERATTTSDRAEAIVAAHDALLVIEVGGVPIAIAVSAIDRLEELSTSAVQRLGHETVVHYRGEVLPLVDVAAALGRGSAKLETNLPVIVCRGGGRNVGLVVDRILDIVDPKQAEHPHGTANALVIAGRVTELVDVRSLINEVAS